ncbi:MAG: hypothetical protein WD267_08180 [Balneolales bacterium]
MAKSTSQVKRKKRKRKDEPDKPMLFSSTNYFIMIVGAIMVLVGFLAMYIENQEKGIIALYISPVVIVAGFITVAVAILKTDKKQVDLDVRTSSTMGE